MINKAAKFNCKILNVKNPEEVKIDDNFAKNLGAKDLNVSAIQQARLQGDGLALTQELTKYLQANGEEMKRNPYLLSKSAEALGFTNDELLKMYANLQQNGKLEEESKATLEARQADIQKVIVAENERLRLAGELAMTREQEEAYLNSEEGQNEICEVLIKAVKRYKFSLEKQLGNTGNAVLQK